ncbi:peptidoglycan DD-metalloendopeptidase family protein [Nevskia sp.]|uniref:peptidoglycan DD-metalloendopeptidase family protein n=1 Tax=Nevskia sp. TaxID=1929292 RepID=UPI0025D7E933|nr:peptidoglycan DD-metalloendopeptidase family protein [Nevskia sp.]
MVPVPKARLSRGLAAALTALLLVGCASETGRRSVSRGASPVTRSKPTYGETHVVAKGDTLYSIAFRNNLDYRELADWNGIGRDYTIRLGQRLRLTPPGGGVIAPPPVAAAKPSSPVVASKRPTTAEPIAIVSGSASWEWPTRGKLARSFAASGSKGIDIAGEAGQLIVAARGGKVVYSGAALKGYGELVIIKHDEQFLSAYGYNRRRLVEEGETVGPGQPIAELGLGPENKPLLHFEIRDRGRPLDPVELLPGR